MNVQVRTWLAATVTSVAIVGLAAVLLAPSLILKLFNFGHATKWLTDLPEVTASSDHATRPSVTMQPRLALEELLKEATAERLDTIRKANLPRDVYALLMSYAGFYSGGMCDGEMDVTKGTHTFTGTNLTIQYDPCDNQGDPPRTLVVQAYLVALHARAANAANAVRLWEYCADLLEQGH